MDKIKKVYRLKINYYDLGGSYKKGQFLVQSSIGSFGLEDFNTNIINQLSNNFVSNNPDIFEECTELYNLIQEAKSRFKAGDRIKIINNPLNILPDNWNEGIFFINKKVKHTFGVQLPHNGFKTTKKNPGYKIWLADLTDIPTWAEIERKPLFTTEDGVEIFKGDKFWVVYKTELVSENGGEYVASEDDKLNSAYKYFSIKEKAQEYIDLNKPRYSKQDIIDAVMNAKMHISPTDTCREVIEKLDKNE